MSTFPKGQVVVGSLCYVVHEERVLLLKRARPPHIGKWSPPGGKMEFGESPEDCVIREIQEETGLTIINPMLRGVQTVVDVDWPIHWLLFIYLAREFTGTLRDTAHEEGELRWIPIADLAQYERPYADQQYWVHVIDDDPQVWRGRYRYNTPDTLMDEIIYDSLKK